MLKQLFIDTPVAIAAAIRGTKMLNKKFRLRKRTEFAYSFKHGKVNFGELINITIFTRRDKLLRIGFSVSKKVGGAVVRNKVRRRMQASVRGLIHHISAGYNLIFVARPGIETKNYDDIKQAIFKQLSRAGLLNGDVCKN